MTEEHLFSAVRLAMKSAKEKCGLDPGDRRPALTRLGYELGHSISKLMTSTTLTELLQELASIWEQEGFGRMEPVSTSPLIINIYDCYDCLGNRYGVGVTLCPFKEGILKVIIEDRLGLPNEVVELECCGTFQDHCRFEVKLPKTPGQTPAEPVEA
ncbi:MAG: hypothetical protein HY619_01230 [Thaumarchaeota archaeon]|nr:hypothetical protein [Nitrososphaerota archaeon]